MSQCCFCNMNCFCVEISFGHNFTRFLNEENGQTTFPSPHTPSFSMTIPNDNTSITREAPEPASMDCWKVPVFCWEYWGLCEGVCRVEIEPQILGKRALHPAVYDHEAIVPLWEEKNITIYLVTCLSEPHADEVRTVSQPRLLIRLMMNRDSRKNEFGSAVAFLYFFSKLPDVFPLQRWKGTTKRRMDGA